MGLRKAFSVRSPRQGENSISCERRDGGRKQELWNNPGEAFKRSTYTTERLTVSIDPMYETAYLCAF